MIETTQVSPERPAPTRERRARLDAESLALLTLPSGSPAGQLPLRAIHLEQRSERLRQRDDQQRALTSEVAGRPRPSDLAREDAQREAPRTGASRESRREMPAARERADASGAGFRRELADARRDAVRPAAGTATQLSTPDSAPPRDATGVSVAAPAAARAPAIAPIRPAAEVLGTQAKPAGQVSSAASPAPAAPVPQRVGVTNALRVSTVVQPTLPARSTGDSQAPRGPNPTPAVTSSVRIEKSTIRPSANRPADAPAAERSDDANLERVLRVLRMQLARDRANATIRLDPAELGQVRMKIDLSGTQLALDVEAEREAARRLLVEQVDALRRGLEAAGIVLERIDVRVVEPALRHDAPGGTSGGASWQAGPNDQGSARRDDPTPIGSASPTAAETVEPVRPEPIPATESLVNILA